MSLQTAWDFAFEFGDRPIQVEESQSLLSSDAGLLIFRQMDERLRYTAQFADALWGDSRVGPKHSWLDMVRQRVYGMLADYEDQNDHDVLRSDPIFKVIAGRDPSDPKQDLASQPTLSRFENDVSIADLNRLRELFVTLFLNPWEACHRRGSRSIWMPGTTRRTGSSSSRCFMGTTISTSIINEEPPAIDFEVAKFARHALAPRLQCGMT